MTNFYLKFIKKNIYGFVFVFGFCVKYKTKTQNQKNLQSSSSFVFTGKNTPEKNNPIANCKNQFGNLSQPNIFNDGREFSHLDQHGIDSSNQDRPSLISPDHKNKQDTQFLSSKNLVSGDCFSSFLEHNRAPKPLMSSGPMSINTISGQPVESSTHQTFDEKKRQKKDYEKKEEKKKKIEKTLDSSLTNNQKDIAIERSIINTTNSFQDKPDIKQIKKEQKEKEKNLKDFKKKKVQNTFLSSQEKNKKKIDLFNYLKQATKSEDNALFAAKEEIILNIKQIKESMFYKEIKRSKKDNLFLYMEYCSFLRASFSDNEKDHLRVTKFREKIDEQKKENEEKKKKHSEHLQRIKLDYIDDHEYTDHSEFTFFDILYWAQISEIFKKDKDKIKFESFLQKFFKGIKIRDKEILEKIEDFVKRNFFSFIQKKQKELDDFFSKIKKKNDLLKGVLKTMNETKKNEFFQKFHNLREIISYKPDKKKLHDLGINIEVKIEQPKQQNIEEQKKSVSSSLIRLNNLNKQLKHDILNIKTRLINFQYTLEIEIQLCEETIEKQLQLGLLILNALTEKKLIKEQIEEAKNKNIGEQKNISQETLLSSLSYLNYLNSLKENQ